MSKVKNIEGRWGALDRSTLYFEIRYKTGPTRNVLCRIKPSHTPKTLRYRRFQTEHLNQK